jgi:hypothetical protein
MAWQQSMCRLDTLAGATAPELSTLLPLHAAIVEDTMSVSRARTAPSRAGSSSQMLLSLGALTGGLLSSSCCVIQLVLNYTSIGCAGFSALTPYRHVFRAMTGMREAAAAAAAHQTAA